MKRPPLILISAGTSCRGAEFRDPSVTLSHRYSAAVATVGAVPWVFPRVTDEGLVREGVRRCDGVLLTGGDDIQPALYTSALPAALRRTVSPTDPARDFTELAVIREVFRQRKPLLALCRGHQLLNVALGGTLWVDLPTQRPDGIRHNRMDRKDVPVHKVTLTPGSLLAKMTGARSLGVNSTHHQAVDRVAPGLRVAAASTDGLVEGLELDDPRALRLPFLVAVQFHPERLYERYPVFLELFRGLIRACRANRRKSV